MKYIDFRKCIPVSGYKIYILMRYVDLMYVDFQKCIKISILMSYADFQKCIPVSGYKYIYFDKVR